MKKEKKRELTIKQLNNRMKVSEWISEFFMFMYTSGVFLTASVLLLINIEMETTVLFGVIIPFIIIEIMNVILNDTFETISGKYENAIIKRMAGEGNIKNKVILRSEKYVNTILSYYCTDSIINIIKNKLEDAVGLSREQKRKIVNSIIQSIEIEKAEEENMNIIIKVDGGECIETKIPEEKLREMFDLKIE
ncbi:MAG: hypothetical protein HFJ42_04690 [Clostridia bacterium]|nr:hypothetical protein [Clostridia bacterium]